MPARAYPDPTREKLLDAALPNVIFDGWGPDTFKKAVADSGVSQALARVSAPRGSLDLAAAYHKRGDRQMVETLEAEDLSAMRFTDRVTHAVWVRMQVVDREIVRRGMSLYSLPHTAPEGTRLVWETADAIWNLLGDTSQDVNWYTKRATLSGVIGSTMLFWLGDDSEDFTATRDFLERRIGDVMQIEKAKATVRDNKALSTLFALPNAFLGLIKAPAGARRDDVPGTTTTKP
ncbi:COQ9 family protein [Celeribacter arenosi]|uniref:COQ9 family protein n=1 Tax=Celeribacter arenosi TaxID=792649 RepID=A0ABP7K108_9RHOB